MTLHQQRSHYANFRPASMPNAHSITAVEHYSKMTCASACSMMATHGAIAVIPPYHIIITIRLPYCYCWLWDCPGPRRRFRPFAS